jgi:hypothetical protein
MILQKSVQDQGDKRGLQVGVGVEIRAGNNIEE